MNFLADESVESQIVEHLREHGHIVQYVAEMAAGIPDETVLSLASDRNLTLLTADKDFGELVFRQRQIGAGIVLLRLAGLSPERKAAIVESTVTSHAEELPLGFTVVTPGIIRIRSQSQ